MSKTPSLEEFIYSNSDFESQIKEFCDSYGLTGGAELGHICKARDDKQ